MPQVKGSGLGQLVTGADGTKYYTDRTTSLKSLVAAGAVAGANAATGATQKTSTAKKTGSKKGSGSTAAAKAAQQAAAMAQLLNLLQGRLDQELAAAQSWYERQSASVKSLYGQLESDLAAGHKLTLADLQKGYQAGVEDTNKSIDKGLVEAFVTKMMGERNIGQKLAAMGIAGGAAESTLLSMANSYGNNVNELETSRAASLAKQLQSYDSAKNRAVQSYNQSLSSTRAKQAQALLGLDTNYAGMISKAQNAFNTSRASALMKMI